MKNTCFLLFFLWSAVLSAIDMSVTPLLFQTSEKSYLEVQLFVLGESVRFVPTNGAGTTAAVNVLMLIKQDTNIVLFEKYILNSPATDRPLDFVDVQRFGLSDGDYVLEVMLEDVNDPTNKAAFEKPISVYFENKKTSFSGIQLLSGFKKDTENSKMSKNGIHLETLPYQFYSKKIKRMRCYSELYNTDQHFDEPFTVRYRIDLSYSNGRSRTMISETIERQPAPVIPLLLQHRIDDLFSGNYRLVLEALDADGQPLAEQSVDFQVSNPNVARIIPQKKAAIQSSFVEPLDSQAVQYSIRAIIPIWENGHADQLDDVLRSDDINQKKQFLLDFWTSQDERNADILYREYMKVARAVDKTYKAGAGPGFETDRGYIFLKYGKPNDVLLVEDEPSAPPYEIWFYNDFPVTSQHNVKFLFYNPTLSVGHFQLLHSTARGELNNPQWEIELYRDDNQSMQTTDFDSTTVPDGVARRARRFFEQ